MVLNLSLLAFYWLWSHIPTFQSIAWPCASVQYWFSYSSANPSVLSFTGSRPAHHSLVSHSSYSGTASNWNTRHTFISCNLPPSHLIKTLHLPLQLLPVDITHLCRSALQNLFSCVSFSLLRILNKQIVLQEEINGPLFVMQIKTHTTPVNCL